VHFAGDRTKCGQDAEQARQIRVIFHRLAPSPVRHRSHGGIDVQPVEYAADTVPRRAFAEFVPLIEKPPLKSGAKKTLPWWKPRESPLSAVFAERYRIWPTIRTHVAGGIMAKLLSIKNHRATGSGIELWV
jgi:hypothetical protein